MDLLCVRSDDHKPQTDPLPGALRTLSEHDVPDVEIASPRAAQVLAALIRPSFLNTATRTASRVAAVAFAAKGLSRPPAPR
jgi:hypothetical protein